jgi:DNA-directed RNA polymerase I subunit RPA43
LTYYPPFEGVVLSYSNPRISEHPHEAQASNNGEIQTVFSRSIDEYGVTYVWLTAEFLVFRPKRGTLLEGHVTLQNESILGLLCYNYFNAGIQAEKLAKDWKWNGEAFEDASGNVVEGKLTFKVEDFEASGTESIQISGTLLY